MPEIGIRELKTHASEIIRKLRDQRARYVVTYRGRAVGLLLPLEEPELEERLLQATADPWEELIQLGREIGQGWQSDQTGGEILEAMRR
jgi:antitoxin (DNA-binding transcriptional repressor) of toxin-antitoxin stability system